MSVVVRVAVVCDAEYIVTATGQVVGKCDYVLQVPDETDPRQMANEYEWTHIKGRDYCPMHSVRTGS